MQVDDLQEWRGIGSSMLISFNFQHMFMVVMVVYFIFISQCGPSSGHQDQRRSLEDRSERAGGRYRLARTVLALCSRAGILHSFWTSPGRCWLQF
jgi:hypothetical protein